MPNWCTNKLEIRGDSDSDALIRVELAGDNGIVDFSKVIPVHPDLQRQGLTDVQKAANKRKYGYNDWYDFCCKEWGTKWNASEMSVGSDGSISFQTAWSPPIPVIKVLSRKYPRTSFRIKYADEGGGFIGYSDVVNGEVENNEFEIDSDESRELQQELYGEEVFSDNDEEEVKEEKKSKKSSKVGSKIASKPIPKFICRERFTEELVQVLDDEFGGGDLYEQALKRKN